MTRAEFITHLTDVVNDYIQFYIGHDRDPQIKINPLSLNTEFVPAGDELRDIAFSDEAVEEAAAADEPASEDATDYQARQDPDYYSVKAFVKTDADGKTYADKKAIEAVADVYFK